MAAARKSADPIGIPADHQPVAIVLDLVDPKCPGRCRAAFDGRHGLMKSEVAARS